MVFFAALMLWSFGSKDYRALRGERPHTNSFKAFLHSQNYWDFIRDTGLAFNFFFDYVLGKSYTRSADSRAFDTAFGVQHNRGYSGSSSRSNKMNLKYADGTQVREATDSSLSRPLRVK
jgi:hypothetical protein